jgi:hypothetical protein
MFWLVPSRSVLHRQGRVGEVTRSRLLPTKEYDVEVPLLELLAPFTLLRAACGTTTLQWTATKTDGAGVDRWAAQDGTRKKRVFYFKIQWQVLEIH